VVYATARFRGADEEAAEADAKAQGDKAVWAVADLFEAIERDQSR
jgi:hypothetical protein